MYVNTSLEIYDDDDDEVIYNLFNTSFGYPLFIESINNIEQLQAKGDLIGYKAKDNIPQINFKFINTVYDDYYSLFGSKFYYSQTNDESKAFLLLSSLPFKNDSRMVNGGDTAFLTQIFNNKGGFVKTSKLWCCYIGSLIWRNEENRKRTNPFDPIYYEDDLIKGLLKTNFPNTNEVLSTVNSIDNKTFGNLSDYPIVGIDEMNMNFTTNSGNDEYNLINEVYTSLPETVKNKFINLFKDWVKKDFKIIKENLEIVPDSNLQTLKDLVNDLHNIINQPTNEREEEYLRKINISDLDNLVNNGKLTSNYKNKFINFTPLSLGNNDLEEIRIIFNPENEGIKRLISNMREDIILVNNDTRIWSLERTIDEPFKIKKDLLFNYLDEFFEQFNTLLNPKEKNSIGEATLTEEEKKAQKKSILANDDVKLNLYRSIKSIYDKWVSGNNGKYMTSCIRSVSSPTNDSFIDPYTNPDISMQYNKNKRSTQDTKPRLIDSFRFVDRAFYDIGDKLKVSPETVSNNITNNYNQSFYDLIGRILADVPMEFQALPTFINYNDPNKLEQMFTPQTFNSMVNDGKTIVGPSFVCVYVGQTSKHLDFGAKNTPFKNDGFNFVIDNSGNLSTDTKETNDMITPQVNDENGTSPMKCSAFAVRFGSQNQSIFKDIKLNQQEFAETSESLIMIDEIAAKGSPTNRTYGKQSLFNVYQTRSYSTEITALGNAMIQPMMYFQLDNIPMYRGAYMITNVKHNIKPNHMTTTFKGTRVRAPKTKLLDLSTIYMSLIGDLSDVDTTNSTGENGSGSGSRGTKSDTRGVDKETINEKVLPIDGKLYLYENGKVYKNDSSYQEESGGNNYGVEPIVKFVNELAVRYNSFAVSYNRQEFGLNPSGITVDEKIYVGDLSKQGGAPIQAHKSHRKGIDVDFRPIYNQITTPPFNSKGISNSPVGLTYKSDNYSLEGTKQFYNNNVTIS